jgi:carbon storage regulator
MLVLTRGIGGEIIITTADGQEITVAVLGVRGNQVRLGVNAPHDVVIDRKEIHERKLIGVADD